jgi:hypothetical protein
MTQIGQAILDREAERVVVVHPRLPELAAAPKGMSITRHAIEGDGGPYRGGPASERVTITYSPSSPWVTLICGIVILAVAHEIASSVGLGWPLTIGIAGAVIAFLAAMSAANIYRIVIDAEAVHAGGPRGRVSIARRDIVGFETCEWRMRIERSSTYYVRTRNIDGSTTELMRLPKREQCWWVQDQLERALRLEPAQSR